MQLEVEASNRHLVEVLLDAVVPPGGMVQMLGALVGLRADGPALVDDGDTGRVWGRNHLCDTAPHVLVEMYSRWLDRAARALASASDASPARGRSAGLDRLRPRRRAAPGGPSGRRSAWASTSGAEACGCRVGSAAAAPIRAVTTTRAVRVLPEMATRGAAARGDRAGCTMSWAACS